jgi:hypothetical protein
MKTFDATITASITMSVSAESEGHAIAKVRDTIPSTVFSKYGSRMLYAITIDDIHLTEIRIMDGSTSHDKRLVNLINQCYAERRDAFFEIVGLLSKRDVDEFDDFDTNTASPYDLAERYLHAIADDLDLQTIINYCRI